MLDDDEKRLRYECAALSALMRIYILDHWAGELTRETIEKGVVPMAKQTAVWMLGEEADESDPNLDPRIVFGSAMHDAIEKYCEAIEASGLEPMTKNTYVDHARRFGRWLSGDDALPQAVE